MMRGRREGGREERGVDKKRRKRNRERGERKRKKSNIKNIFTFCNLLYLFLNATVATLAPVRPPKEYTGYVLT